jgi:hypothetical protein
VLHLRFSGGGRIADVLIMFLSDEESIEGCQFFPTNRMPICDGDHPTDIIE